MGSYYRLKMIDIDGKFTYGRTIKITGVSIAGINIQQVSPVPFTNSLILNISSDKNMQAQVLITDMTGRTQVQQSLQLLKGSGVYSINGLEKLANGTYILNIVTIDGKRIVERVQK